MYRRNLEWTVWSLEKYFDKYKLLPPEARLFWPLKKLRLLCCAWRLDRHRERRPNIFLCVVLLTIRNSLAMAGTVVLYIAGLLGASESGTRLLLSLFSCKLEAACDLYTPERFSMRQWAQCPPCGQSPKQHQQAACVVRAWDETVQYSWLSINTTSRRFSFAIVVV